MPAAFALAIGLAALVYHPSASAADSKSVALAVVGIIALSLAMRAFWRERGIATGITGWLLVCAYASASLAWADHPSALHLLPWLAGGALGVVACALPLEQRQQLTTRVAAVIAGGTSLWLLYAFAGGARGMLLHGSHGNPDWAGMVVAAALPLLVDGYRRDASRQRWLYGAVALLCVPALALSGSRTAVIALLLVTLLFAGGRARLLMLAPLTVVLCYLAIGTRLDTAWQGRAWLWKSSGLAAIDGLPLGHGQGDFAFTYLDAQGPMLAQLSLDEAALRFVNATTAHNDWLQALVEGGLVQLILLAVTLLLGVVTLWGRHLGGAASVAVIAVCSLGDAALMQPAIVVLLCLTLACTPLPIPRPGKMEAGTAIALLAALAVALPAGVRSWLTAKELQSIASHQPDARLAGLEQAVDFNPDSGDANLALGLALLSRGDRVHAMRALAPLERSRELLANVSTDVALGNAHLLAADHDAAIDAYRRALARHPALFRARMNLAEALRRAGKLDAAERELAAARELQPNHPKLRRIAEQLRRDRIDADTR